jgi:hypothetical protein
MAEQLSLFNEEPEMVQNTSDETVTPISDVEWCYQFFDNEPVVFGFGQEEGKANPLVIQLRPVAEDVLVFNHNGMAFKIFPREISADSIELRKQQKQKENESQNQEAAQ